MTKFIINGGSKLEGTLPVFGAKNACLPLICATLLTSEEVVLKNVPDLKDINLLCELLAETGSICNFDKEQKTLTINSGVNKTQISHKADQMRASVLMIAPLLGTTRKVKIPYPGGCSIGGRPIDVTLDGLKALGVEFENNSEFIIGSTKELKGTEFTLRIPSVGATEALVMAACVAQGTTILNNVAKEPEIIDLIDLLNSMGADIQVQNKSIIINGVSNLHGTTHNVVPDRIIAGTYAILAALSAGEKGILIKNCVPDHIKSELSVLIKAGVMMQINEDSIFIPEQKNSFQATDFDTDFYDGFATDLQAPMMTFLTQTKGESHITENIYENRFMHIVPLNEMKADIRQLSNHLAVVKGTTELEGSTVKSTDLRASAALIIAGLIAKGQTIVEEIKHLDRGYQTLEIFLQNIGADIKRVED